MFRFFRRYQKTFIVIGGVILMFVFTVGDTITQWISSQNNTITRSPNATAVSWDGGQLSEGRLNELVYQRRLAGMFVSAAYTIGQQKAEEAGLPATQRVLPIGLYNRETSLEVLEQDVVRRYILAQEAEKMGVVISDDMILRYIDELGLGQLSGDDVVAMLDALFPAGRAPSTTDLFDALRHEMMAEAGLRALGSSGTVMDMFAAEMPVERWEEWKQVNDHIVVEAAAIDPNKSLVDVADPTDKEISEFYEKYKDDPGFPVMIQSGTILPSPTPGFTIPRKIKLAYLRANFEEFVDKYQAEITDEEIAQYYEENKYQFTVNNLESFFDDAEESTDEATEGDATAAEEPAAEEPAATEEPATEEPATEEPATEEPAAEEPAAEEPAVEEPATEEPVAEETPAEEPATPEAEAPEAEAPADEQPEAPAPEGESNAKRPSPFRLVSLQEETTEEAPAEETTTDEATTEEAPAEPAEEPATEEAAAETEPAATETETAMPAEGEAGESETSLEVEYEPLEKVADKIRRRIAEDRYETKVREILQSATSELRPAYSKYMTAELDAEAKNEPAPTPPAELTDLSPLAEKYGLEFETTEAMSIYEMYETPVGKSFCDTKYVGGQPAIVTQVVFENAAEMFEPMTSTDLGRFSDFYVVVKIADTPSRVPPLEEVKDKVIAAWKKDQAAEKALEKAKEIAKKAQESGESLADYFVDDESVTVTKTPTFTLRTQGDFAATGQMDYRLSQPEGLENVDGVFLTELFKLNQGETTALLNFDKSIVYVVRIADEVESPELLRSNFLEEANYWLGRFYYRNRKLQNLRPATAQTLMQDLNIEWQRPEETETTDEAAETES